MGDKLTLSFLFFFFRKVDLFPICCEHLLAYHPGDNQCYSIHLRSDQMIKYCQRLTENPSLLLTTFRGLVEM